MYSTETAKTRAYQFSDPFALSAFFVCNKVGKCFCRPNCDARQVTNLKSEIKFVDLVNEALALGYNPCEYCEPTRPGFNVQLLVECVSHVNEQIKFLPPLIEDNEENMNSQIKENILESKKNNEEQIMKMIGGRRASAPAINFDSKFLKDFESMSLSKNDFDHYRLVDLACRHLAYAAAVNILQPNGQKGLRSPGSPDSGNLRKRKRRGGVLGFKELAAKSKLSAWHFHRVFKSVTGLTPKTYGDKCWEYIKVCKEKGANFFFEEKHASTDSGEDSVSPPNMYYQTQTPISSNSNLHNNFSESDEENVKKVKLSPEAEQDNTAKINFGKNLSNPGEAFFYTPEADGVDNNLKSTGLKLSFNDKDTGINPSSIEDGLVPPASSFDFNLNDATIPNVDDFDDFAKDTQFLNDDCSGFVRAFSAPDLTKYNYMSALSPESNCNNELNKPKDAQGLDSYFDTDINNQDNSGNAFYPIVDDVPPLSGAGFITNASIQNASMLRPFEDNMDVQDAADIPKFGYDIDPLAPPTPGLEFELRSRPSVAQPD